MKIIQKSRKIVLDMGPKAPVLTLLPMPAEAGEIWPMRWAAVRPNCEDLAKRLYIAELPDGNSKRLLMKLPGGDDRAIEFVRLEGVEASPLASPSPTVSVDAEPKGDADLGSL